MAENNDALNNLSAAGDEAIDLINRVDVATGKFQPGKRQGSIIKAAQKNIFEFPVFISNSVPLDYATATVSLLEQNYAAYLQMAISINPVVDAKTVKNGLQFAQYKVDTNKYLEYTEPGFQHDVCHNVIQEGKYSFEFDLMSIEDSEARIINEAVDHQPLSEFDHFFQEDSAQNLSDMTDNTINTINNNNGARSETFVPNLDLKNIDPSVIADASISISSGDVQQTEKCIDEIKTNIVTNNSVIEMVPWSVFKTSVEKEFDKKTADAILNAYDNIFNADRSQIHDPDMIQQLDRLPSFMGSYNNGQDFNTLSKTFYNLSTTKNTLATADKQALQQALNDYGANGDKFSQTSKDTIARLFGTQQDVSQTAKMLYSSEHIGDLSYFASALTPFTKLPPGMQSILGNETNYNNMLAEVSNRRIHLKNQNTLDAQNIASNDQNSLLNAIKLNTPQHMLTNDQLKMLGVTADPTIDSEGYKRQCRNAIKLYETMKNRYNASSDKARQDMLYNKLARGGTLESNELSELGLTPVQADIIKKQVETQRGYDANRDLLTQAQTASTNFNYAMNKLNNGIELNDVERKNLGVTNDDDYERLKAQAQALRDRDLAQSQILQRQAQKANSKFYRGAEALQTGLNVANTAANTVNAATNAAYNIATFRDRKANAKLQNQNMELQQEKLKQDLADHDELMRMKKNEMYGKMKTSNIQYVDDSKCNKMNTMKPLLMKVTLSMLNKDDSIQPIEYVIGVKTHNRVIPASILPEVAKYPLKEMDKISRKIKWRAGELKFLKDLVFRINEKKQTAADARDPNRKWYRRLYELAHMKGDAPATAVVQGKSIFGTFIRDKQGKGKLMHGFIPNAAIVMSQADVNNIKQQTEIDLLKGSSAKKFCGELFLMNLVVIDTDAGSIKIMQPDENNDYSVHSLASVNKQLATLDTAGTKTRDMFKLLG